eukprot:scaffold10647_cov113-Isochrysis_galbana.AAC.12
MGWGSGASPSAEPPRMVARARSARGGAAGGGGRRRTKQKMPTATTMLCRSRRYWKPCHRLTRACWPLESAWGSRGLGGGVGSGSSAAGTRFETARGVTT